MSKKASQQTVVLAPGGRMSEDSHRTLQALVMRREGQSYELIGDRLGVDPWTARQLVSVAYSRLSTEQADELRAAVEDRLDDVLRRLYQDLNLAETQNARNSIYSLILKTEAQRSRLLGLDIPQGFPDDPQAAPDA